MCGRADHVTAASSGGLAGLPTAASPGSRCPAPSHIEGTGEGIHTDENDGVLCIDNLGVVAIGPGISASCDLAETGLVGGHDGGKLFVIDLGDVGQLQEIDGGLLGCASGADARGGQVPGVALPTFASRQANLASFRRPPP